MRAEVLTSFELDQLGTPIAALVATPLSPFTELEPVPAIVVIVPLEATFRMR